MSDDARLAEQRIDGETLVEGGFLELRRDRVLLPDGKEATREYIVHPGAVAVIPLLDDGRLVMVRQYRYPIGRSIIEFPAGKLDAGETTIECARRELREETGYSAREWAFACEIHNAAAYSSESIWIYFARGLVAGAQKLDEGEFVEVLTLSEAELDALAAGSGLPDVKTRIGLHWLQRWRAGAWPLQWRSDEAAGAET
ncbi:MAG: NUDIX hydrolase [Burkholderiales bacterium]|nr:NUDIX hydrolase [Burkholderiales bacterium]MDE2398103.1 NUDIX hydrolase [Burkholderiales bacterium]MDE2455156.1 NUDIX hydrolase [Burkholderiales bacterium]